MARKGSLAYWEEQFKNASREYGSIQEQIDKLENLYAKIVRDMKRFEKEIEQGPDRNAISEIISALMGYTVDVLIEEFDTASYMTEGDITDAMMDNLFDIVYAKMVPSITYNDGVIEMNLVDDCNRYLGSVDSWFRIVEQARRTNATTPEARMIGWRQLFDAGVHGISMSRTSVGVLQARYEHVIALRMSLLSQTAPYWHFLEYGNDRRKAGVLYPYPTYSAPRAVSTAQERVINEAKNRLAHVEKIYDIHRTDGWYKRRDIVDKIRWLIEELYEELRKQEEEEDLDEAARIIRGMVTRYVKSWFSEYRGLETLEKLTMDDLHEIRDEIIYTMANYQMFGDERVSIKGFTGRTRQLRIDIEEYIRNIGLDDVGLSDIF